MSLCCSTFRRHVSRRALCLSLATVATACFEAIDEKTDDTSLTTSGADTATNSSSDTPSIMYCGENASCLPVPPADWIVYAVLWQEPAVDGGPSRPDCPESFTRDRFEIDVFADSQLVTVALACLGDPLDVEGCPSEGDVNCVPHPPSPFDFPICTLYTGGVTDCPSDTPFTDQHLFSVNGEQEHIVTFCCMPE